VKHLDFMASDRAYFKKHKRREYRIRRVMPGELLPPDQNPPTHVVVRQIAPGVRARQFFTLPDLPGHKWTEEAARTLWEEGWLQLPVPDFPPPTDGKWPEPPRAPVVPMPEGKQ